MRNVYTLIAIAAAATLTACHFGKKSTEEEMGPQEVSVAYPTTDSIVLHQEFPAMLSANKETDIVARVNGNVVAEYFNDGQTVTAGQPLYSIESTTYADRVQQAEASLQSATASHEYAVKQYEAMKRALESDAVSKMDVVQAESNMNQAAANIKNAKAALQTARTQLGYCTIRAPFAGRLAKGIYTVGDYVSGENAPVTVTTIYDDSEVKANFSVDNDRYMQIMDSRNSSELDFNKVAVNFGDSIVRTYYGRLDYQAPDVNQTTGTVNMRVRIDNRSGELKSGMYATVDLPTGIRPKAILIRDASISTDQLGKFVYVVNDSNRVVYTPIKVGELYHDSLRIVVAGLQPTDRYVTQALLKVRDGMTVKPVVTK